MHQCFEHQAATYRHLTVVGMTADHLAIVADPKNQAIIQAPAIPYNLDAWDGYAYEREALYGICKALQKKVVVLAGVVSLALMPLVRAQAQSASWLALAGGALCVALAYFGLHVLLGGWLGMPAPQPACPPC